MGRVMFVCNSGGHLSEMLELENIIKKYEYVLITEETETAKNLSDKYNVKYVNYMSRKNMIKYFIIGFINVIKAIINIIKFNPKVIVSTGACIGSIYCFVGKFLGKKIVYIESIARVTSLSGTGKCVYKIADEFYVQWEQLTEKYTKSKYLGRFE